MYVIITGMTENTPKPKTGSRKKEQTRTTDGKFAPKLTRKQKAWSDTYLKDKKASLAEIARQTYNVTDTKTAYAISRQNLENTGIQIYLQEHIDKAQKKIVDLLDADKEEIQLRSAQDILDRTHGKATQRTEVEHRGVTLNIDLTSSLEQ